MQFRIGQISAKCGGCGGTQFRIAGEKHTGPRMNYLCAQCGKVTQYAKLVMQIGREALKQRKTRLAGEA